MLAWALKNPVPLGVSLLLHGVLLAAMLWAMPSPKPSKNEVKKIPYVSAKLVKLEAQAKPKKASPKKPKVVDLTKKRKEQERKKKLAEQKRKKQLEKKRAEEKKKADAEKKRQEQARKDKALKEAQARKDALRKQQEQAMAEAKAEQERLEASYAQTAQSFMAVVKERIEANWNRPPSARKNMSCLLRLQLVPTGRVINVDVEKSSGNPLFDRSAVQAVKKAEQFPELKKMPIEVFERYYREFNLLFKPEDLRQ